MALENTAAAATTAGLDDILSGTKPTSAAAPATRPVAAAPVRTTEPAADAKATPASKARTQVTTTTDVRIELDSDALLGVLKAAFDIPDGNSMLPILSNPSTCEYRKQETYAIGDIVFCKVKGRFIDAHKITKVGADGRFMIANNHGFENGWTREIYGRVVAATDSSGRTRRFD